MASSLLLPSRSYVVNLRGWKAALLDQAEPASAPHGSSSMELMTTPELFVMRLFFVIGSSCTQDAALPYCTASKPDPEYTYPRFQPQATLNQLISATTCPPRTLERR